MTVKENSEKIADNSERTAKLETIIPIIQEDISEIKIDIKIIMDKFVNQKKLKIAYFTFLAGLFSVLGYIIRIFVG
jgi:hypothetical protein